MSLCSKTIFCIYWIELTQIFVIVSGNECPVQIVSNRLSPSKENNGRSVFGGEQWENHDYFPQAKLNIKRPDKGSSRYQRTRNFCFRYTYIYVTGISRNIYIIYTRYLIMQ